MVNTLSRRQLIKGASALAAGGVMDLTLVNLAFGEEGGAGDFTFAYISDSHIQHIEGAKFVRNWDRGLMRAVAEANLLDPKPDFVMFGGDLAQLGKREELDHGMEILSGLRYDNVRFVLGEHDYYLDLGEYWSEITKLPHWYSFDHKGVHFVVLNSILVDEDWINKWPSGAFRMNVMAGLDDPRGSPFMVGEKQRQWLAADLARIPKSTPVVVFSHSPIQKIFKNWNFWTDDAEQVQALLAPFDRSTVIYGHVHQIQYNQIGNISFNSVMGTSWPWPYPEAYAQAGSHLPVITVPMNRADPFHERDATGWQFVDVNTGNVALNYSLPDNSPRTVAYDPKLKRPRDLQFAEREIPPQKHY